MNSNLIKAINITIYMALIIETPLFFGLLTNYKNTKKDYQFYKSYVDNADFFFDKAYNLVDDNGLDYGLINITAEQLRKAGERQTITSVEDYETSSKVKKDKSKISTEEWLTLAMQGLSTIAQGVSGSVKMSNANTVNAAKAGI